MLKNLALMHISSEIDEQVIKKDQNSFEKELQFLKDILNGKEKSTLPSFIDEYKRVFHVFLENNHSQDLKKSFFEHIKYIYADKNLVFQALKEFELETISKPDLKIQDKEFLLGNIMNKVILQNTLNDYENTSFSDNLKFKIKQSLSKFRNDPSRKVFISLTDDELENLLMVLIKDLEPSKVIADFLSATTIEIFNINSDGDLNLEETANNIIEGLSKKIEKVNKSLEAQIDYHWYLLIDRLLSTVVEKSSLSNYLSSDAIRIPIVKKLDEIETKLFEVKKEINSKSLSSFKEYVSNKLDFKNENFTQPNELKDFIQHNFISKGSVLDNFLMERNILAELVSVINISSLKIDLEEDDFSSEGFIERINNFILILKTHPINSLKITIKDPLIKDITFKEMIASNGLWHQIRKKTFLYIKSLQDSIKEIDNNDILNFSKMENSPLVDKFLYLAERKIDSRTLMLDKFNISLIDREKQGDIKSLFRSGFLKAIKIALNPANLMDVALDATGEFVGFVSDDGKITKKKNSELYEYLNELKQEYADELEKILIERFQI